jgi:hypothetical protein
MKRKRVLKQLLNGPNFTAPMQARSKYMVILKYGAHKITIHYRAHLFKSTRRMEHTNEYGSETFILGKVS